jgi:hypothetical protein
MPPIPLPAMPPMPVLLLLLPQPASPKTATLARPPMKSAPIPTRKNVFAMTINASVARRGDFRIFETVSLVALCPAHF